MTSSILQDLKGCTSPSFDLDLYEARLHHALDKLKNAYHAGSLPFLKITEEKDDVYALHPHVDHFKNFDNILIFGTGGSSLGGRTLVDLVQNSWKKNDHSPRIEFIENIDPDTFRSLGEAIDFEKTGFMIISKSGFTSETLVQFLSLLSIFPASFHIPHHVLVITEPKDNPLRNLARHLNIPCLDHDPNIGGRYSVFSLVGVLPALIAGLDVLQLRAGANKCLKAVLKEGIDHPLVQGVARMHHLQEREKITSFVLMPYSDRLISLGLWFRQLWAESLGKEGQGSTPINALGTVDQHSQLQLYLDGPRDKVITVVTLHTMPLGPTLKELYLSDPRLGYLKGTTMSQLLQAEQRATATSLINKGIPTRVLNLSTLNEVVLGELLMQFMLETIFMSYMMNINAFDQPAVEEIKNLTRHYLQASLKETL